MSDTEHREQTTEQTARRRLLKLAGYVPPALLGAMLLNRPAIAAAPPGKCPIGGGGFISAPAGSCCPCVPVSTDYSPRKCCKDHCDPAGCSAYVQSKGYSGKSCEDVNNWCGTTPAGCNCCLDKKGRFKCENPGLPCP